MWGYVQHQRRDEEAGGMLIGHHPVDSQDIVLDRLTTPQPEDRRSRCRFHRDQAAHQQLLDLHWMASGGKRTYVGEWHTHPEARPSPSGLDLRSWRKALRGTAFQGPGLLFIIVGTETASIWFGTTHEPTIHMLGERVVPPLEYPGKGASN
ncbi:Mov34/MPN/PAD-1 family protein [Deinococcus sp. RM]|uniref:Mov34/MPN/PAD-1 family protein n=1 Tax=Deinococcus sp. RM TaxID=2316359 RepID=UPI003AB43D63